MKTTGGGPPPTPPKPKEEISLAASMMSVDLAMGNDVYESFRIAPDINDSESNVYVLQEEGKFSVDLISIPGVCVCPHQYRKCLSLLSAPTVFHI